MKMHYKHTPSAAYRQYKEQHTTTSIVEGKYYTVETVVDVHARTATANVYIERKIGNASLVKTSIVN